MQAVFDTLFGNVTLSGLAASVIFGAVVIVLEFRKLSKEIESVRSFQSEIAEKVTELEQRLGAIESF